LAHGYVNISKTVIVDVAGGPDQIAGGIRRGGRVYDSVAIEA
jgi:hypothetical protein